MKILLYNPDNGITRNFMPHLWMFLLQALTPKEHEVILIDGNAKAMTRAGVSCSYCKDRKRRTGRDRRNDANGRAGL